MPAFTPPGPAFDAPKLMHGKSVMSIPVTSQLPITTAIEKRFAQRAAEVGFKFTHYENQGQQDQWVRGFNLATSQHTNVIDIPAINPSVIGPQIKAAQQAGTKVISSYQAGVEQHVDLVDAKTGLPYQEAGALLAAWAVVKTKGNLDTLVSIDPTQSSSESIRAGLDSVFSKCSTCKVKYVEVPTSNWQTQLQSSISAALSADPNVNYVISTFDSAITFILPAIKAAHLDGKVGIDGYNGTPFVLDLIKKGDVQMDVGNDENWVADAILDNDMRVAAGLPALDDEKIGTFIWDSDSVAKYGNKDALLDTNYTDGYAKLWGLK
jgi:ribose transport system substrate-binding protein